VCGRDPKGTERAVAALSEEHGGGLMRGQSCDVADYEQVRALWGAAVRHFGGVDVWINNAGLADPGGDFWEIPAERIDEVIRTNLLGVMHGSKVAMRGMLEQGHGQILNMEGLGSDGRFVRPGALVYGATKSAVTYFTKGLVKEAKDTPVRVGFLSPEIVVTHLLTAGDIEGSRRFLSAVADRVETVAPFLVARILENDRHGARIDWLSRRKLA
jgi:NADP-dependent 3-hydroxy acid dehydrogenase YdfG